VLWPIKKSDLIWVAFDTDSLAGIQLSFKLSAVVFSDYSLWFQTHIYDSRVYHISHLSSSRFVRAVARNVVIIFSYCL